MGQIVGVLVESAADVGELRQPRPAKRWDRRARNTAPPDAADWFNETRGRSYLPGRLNSAQKEEAERRSHALGLDTTTLGGL